MKVFLLLRTIILSLLNGVNKGEQEAIKQLYNKYHQDLFAIIKYKVSDVDVAEDLLQDTFLSFIQILFKRGVRFQTEAKLKNYLITTACNKVIDYYRTQGRKMKKDVLFNNTDQMNKILEDLANSKNPEDMVLNKERMKKLKEQQSNRYPCGPVLHHTKKRKYLY